MTDEQIIELLTWRYGPGWQKIDDKYPQIFCQFTESGHCIRELMAVNVLEEAPYWAVAKTGAEYRALKVAHDEFGRTPIRVLHLSEFTDQLKQKYADAMAARELWKSAVAALNQHREVQQR